MNRNQRSYQRLGFQSMICYAPDLGGGAGDGTQNSVTTTGQPSVKDVVTETIKVGDDEIQIERLPGEKPADFSMLDDEEPAPEPVRTEEPPKTEKPPVKEEKPAGEPPNAEKKALTETPVEEIPEKVDEKAKTAAEEAAKAEAAKKAAETPKAIPDDDKDIEAIQPKPGSSPKIKNDFDALKLAAKEARTLARSEAAEKARIATEKAELEKKLAEVKPVSPELDKELTELRTYRAQRELGDDPLIKKEFEDKMTTANERVLALLKAEGMPDEHADPKVTTLKMLREGGLDKMSEAWWKKNVLDKLADAPILQAKLQSALLAREQVKEEKAARLADIAKNGEVHVKQQEEKLKEHWTNFGKKINEVATTEAKAMGNLAPIPITPEMKPEDKAKAEAHNAEIAEGEKQFTDYVQKAVAHDPETIAKMAVTMLRLPREIKAHEATKAELVKEKARIVELETELAGVSRAGKITKASGAPKTPEANKTQQPKLGMTSEEAFEAAGL